jgi:hypothetical protein
MDKFFTLPTAMWQRSLSKRSAPVFASEDWRDASDAEGARAFKEYFGDFGTFSIDQGKEAVIHHIDGAWFPNLLGTDQIRVLQFVGNQLVLDADTEWGKVRIEWKRRKTLPRPFKFSVDLEHDLTEHVSFCKTFVCLMGVFEFVGRGNGNLERRLRHGATQSFELSKSRRRVISDAFDPTVLSRFWLNSVWISFLQRHGQSDRNPQ